MFWMITVIAGLIHPLLGAAALLITVISMQETMNRSANAPKVRPTRRRRQHLTLCKTGVRRSKACRVIPLGTAQELSRMLS